MVKARGLSAQPALHVLRKVADAYTTRQANLTNGNYGRPGSKRYTAVAGTAVAFRPQFATDINHQLSKTIVAKAQRTGRGIAIEDLSGIPDRVRLARRQRTQLHSWGYAQLRARLPTRPRWLGCPSLSSTPGTPREPAHSAGTATKRTGFPKQHSDAGTASGPVTPTTTRPATSPHSDIAPTGPPNQPRP